MKSAECLIGLTDEERRNLTAALNAALEHEKFAARGARWRALRSRLAIREETTHAAAR